MHLNQNVNKFAISSDTALILRIKALRSYLKLICEYELQPHTLLNTTVSECSNKIMVETT